MKLKNDKNSFFIRARKDISKNYGAYLLILPVIIFYIIFSYKPMYGALIAFKNYSPGKGIIGSSFAADFGFKHFIDFFNSYYFSRILKNTVVISLTSLIFSFPAPIILALLLNEVKNKSFKKAVQTISYMPHFISLVVVCSLIKLFTSDTGIVTYIAALFGYDSGSMLSQPNLFVPVYVISGIWQHLGWDSIIYLAALSGIDQSLYEAAKIDGANRFKQMLHITLPGISSTIIILFILAIGGIMNVGYEKIILLYNPGIYDTADVISSFVYRKGLLESNWSYSAAVGLFNSVINFILVVVFNKLSRKVSEVSLW
ncbi:ABC transporter permease [Anaerocolumna sp. MB42-C2]|uniref:ABC transporter permease n=1 Tax=Anaerocolumna sp. MB42-C2 TaxID=3070997 RepID=UPI0027E019BB|nr:ABC transporter permease subunit [Anaerocolumna sp. MB42-C2]WMJ86902.1 ABC transporter permease subunit [Anaerocolumna sp. MB42-C2]